MVTSSYCSIYTRYIDYTSLPFKRNENDIANKITYKTNHYQHWIRIEPSKQPYLFFCLWYTKDFILWMRRINVIGYTNLFRICFIQYVMISCVHPFDTELGVDTFLCIWIDIQTLFIVVFLEFAQNNVLCSSSSLLFRVYFDG